MYRHPIHCKCFSLGLGWEFWGYFSAFLGIFHFSEQYHQVLYSKLFLRDNQVLACGLIMNPLTLSIFFQPFTIFIENFTYNFKLRMIALKFTFSLLQSRGKLSFLNDFFFGRIVRPVEHTMMGVVLFLTAHYLFAAPKFVSGQDCLSWGCFLTG